MIGITGRAALSVRRKWGRSLLLLLIILLLSTFALSGLSLYHASDTAAYNLRRAMGGSFTLTPQSGGAVLNDESVQAVRELTDVRTWSARMERYVMLPGFDLIQANPYHAEDEKMRNTTTCEGNTQTALNPLFQKGVLGLVKGRHPADDETPSAIISTTLAAQNDLSIGDEIELKLNDELQYVSPGMEENILRLRIVGLFEIKEPQTETSLSPPYALYENRIFIDASSAGDFFAPTGKQGFDSVTFFIDDPADTVQAIESVQASGNSNLQALKFTANDQEYKTIAKPLNNMLGLIGTTLIIVVLFGAACLTLILVLVMRNRRNETGIMLSLGIHKGHIILQYFCEVLSLFCISMTGAYFVNLALVQKIGTLLMNNLQVQIRVGDAFLVAAAGVAIIWISVFLSCIPVMRMNPKSILTQIS